MNSWILSLGDRTVLGYYWDAKTLGVYGATYGLASLLIAIAAPFWSSLYPNLARCHGGSGPASPDRDAIDRVFRSFTGAFLIVGVPATVGLVFVSPQILVLLGHAEFVVSRWVFVLIAGGLFFDQAASCLHYLLYLHSDVNFIKNASLGAGILNLGANILLVPSFGIPGAAFSTLVSYLALSVAVVVRVRGHGYRLRALYDLGSIGRFVLAAVLMLAALVLVESAVRPIPAEGVVPLVRAVVIGVVAYLTALCVLYRFDLRQLLAVVKL